MQLIEPNWPVARNIHAFTTTRIGGVSLFPFDSLNMGSRVEDDLNAVDENRRRVMLAKQVPSMPYWLHQIHSTNVVELPLIDHMMTNETEPVQADGAYTSQANQVCAVLTADCMPVLFCSKHGDEVAAAHAGWRGLCHGILEQTVKRFRCAPQDILVWMGPTIGPSKFEVGEEVKQQFEQVDLLASQAFKSIPDKSNKYLADLYLIAKQRLTHLGIELVFGGEHCTFTQSAQFYSYRRNGKTGRMASMIWFE